MTRVIALGLDAASPEYVDELVARGDLPNLARLRRRAAHVPLRGDSTYRAEFPWTEFTTGRRAESLRYWSTVTFDPVTYAAHMRGASVAEPFYAFGDAATVVAFDLPKVVRSPAVKGIQALGWGAHSPQYPLGSRPDGVLDAVAARFGTHPALPIEYAGSWNQPEYLSRFGRAQADGARRRGEILRWLAEGSPRWDLLLTLFGETHQSGHVMWHGACGNSLVSGTASAQAAGVAYHDIHRGIDNALGAMLDWAPDDATIIVFSVHGMGTGNDDPVASALIPELMFRLGTGEARLPVNDLAAWRRGGAPPVVLPAWDHPVFWRRRHFGGRPAPRRDLARTWLRHVMRRHAPWAVAARRRLLGLDGRRPGGPSTGAGPASPVAAFPFEDHSMNDWYPATWYRDAWPRLPALVVNSYADAHIRINLAGRERDGIVPLDRYERACADVERILAACRDARTGRPVVVDVCRMRTGDPLDPDGPTADLIARLEGTDAIEHPDAGPIGPVVVGRVGTHTEHGFADIAGPGITPGVRPVHRPCDLSATICALLDRPTTVPLDGRSILARHQRA